jgi:hypothetical protein
MLDDHGGRAGFWLSDVVELRSSSPSQSASLAPLACARRVREVGRRRLPKIWGIEVPTRFSEIAMGGGLGSRGGRSCDRKGTRFFVQAPPRADFTPRAVSCELSAGGRRCEGFSRRFLGRTTLEAEVVERLEQRMLNLEERVKTRIGAHHASPS